MARKMAQKGPAKRDPKAAARNDRAGRAHRG
jgi:hypothetical protein